MRLAAAQFRELEAFSQFASDLDEATRKQLNHGYKVTEICKQDQFQPLSVAKMALSLFIVNEELLADTKKEEVANVESSFHQYVEKHHKDILESIELKPELTEELTNNLITIFEKFKDKQVSI